MRNFWHVEMMILEPRCNRSLVIIIVSSIIIICSNCFGNGERTEWSPIRSVIITVVIVITVSSQVMEERETYIKRLTKEA